MTQNKPISFVLMLLTTLVSTGTYQARSLKDVMNDDHTFYRVNLRGTVVSFRNQELTEITCGEIVALKQKYPHLQVLDLIANRLTAIPQNLELLELTKLFLNVECCSARNLQILSERLLGTEIRMTSNRRSITSLGAGEHYPQLLFERGRAAGSEPIELLPEVHFNSDLLRYRLLPAHRGRMEITWVPLHSIISDATVVYEDMFIEHAGMERLDENYLVLVNGSGTMLDISIHQLEYISQSDVSQIVMAFPNLKVVVINEKYSSYPFVKYLKN